MHVCGCVRLPGFVRVITPTFIHGFQNYLTQLFVLEEEQCHLKHVLGRLRVNVTLAGHINEIFRAITPTYMHGFQNNFALVLSLRNGSAI